MCLADGCDIKTPNAPSIPSVPSVKIPLQSPDGSGAGLFWKPTGSLGLTLNRG